MVIHMVMKVIHMAMVGIRMTDSIYKLQTWFSPSYPVGSYTYSHGLENAFEVEAITNVAEAIDWIKDIIAHGSGLADAVFLNEAYKAVCNQDDDRLVSVIEYATAFCGTAELRLESEQQGAAFLDIIQNVEDNPELWKIIYLWQGAYPYAVVVGAAAGALAIDAHALTTAFLHGFVANMSSALVRIVPFGQTDGQRIISALAPIVEQTTQAALNMTFEQITTSTMMVDLTSMQHETQYTRLFRS